MISRTLMKIAPIAIGGLIAILFFKKAFSTSFSEAGAGLGMGSTAIGTGIGTGIGSLGTGIGSFGQGIGTGISGLFKPVWELINIGNAITGNSGITKQNTALDTGATNMRGVNEGKLSPASQRVSGNSRVSWSSGQVRTVPLSDTAKAYYRKLGVSVD